MSVVPGALDLYGDEWELANHDASGLSKVTHKLSSLPTASLVNAARFPSSMFHVPQTYGDLGLSLDTELSQTSLEDLHL